MNEMLFIFAIITMSITFFLSGLAFGEKRNKIGIFALSCGIFCLILNIISTIR